MLRLIDRGGEELQRHGEARPLHVVEPDLVRAGGEGDEARATDRAVKTVVVDLLHVVDVEDAAVVRDEAEAVRPGLRDVESAECLPVGWPSHRQRGPA